MSDDELRVARRVPRNADGTVTVSTLDHGEVRLACPSWCVGGHSYPHGVARVDISHDGEPVWALAVTEEYGESGHVEVSLVQWPFSSRPQAVLHVESDAEPMELGPSGARVVAAALRTHADTIDALADQLAAIREADE